MRRIVHCLSLALALALPACDPDGASATSDAPPNGEVADAATHTIRLMTYVGSSAANLAFVAVQDGDGPWQVASGDAGTYMFSSTGRYGIAIACPSGSDVSLFAYQLAVADTADPIAGCPAPSQTVTISGTVTGLSTGQSAHVWVGPSGASANVGPNGTYSLPVPPGTWDLVATRVTLGRDELIMTHRDLVVAGPTTRDIHFTLAATPLLSRIVTITGADPQQASVKNSFRLHRGGAVQLSAGKERSAVVVVPPDLLRGNDVQKIYAETTDLTTRTSRATSVFAKIPGNLVMAFPPAAEVSFVSETTPTARLGITFADRPDADLYQLAIVNETVTAERHASAYVSEAWLGGAATHDYTFPDLSALTDWGPTWTFDPAAPTEMYFYAYGSNRGVTDVLSVIAFRPTVEALPDLDGFDYSVAYRSSGVLP